MSGNFIFRHHVEPRVKLYSPREESFPIPLKYIDVSRTTHTNLDVKQEKRIGDYWNIGGSRDLSDPWTGFTRFTLLEEKPPDGYVWSGGGETDKKAVNIEARSFMARMLQFSSLMDICHLKNAELEAKHQKYKGRVVLRGDIVKDDSGSYAVFTEQGSSASQMTAAKVMDIISRLPGCSSQAADAVSAYTQVKMEDASMLLENFQSHNVLILG